MEKPRHSDPDELLRRVMETGRNVKFGRGLVSKTGYVVLGVVGVWVGIVWRIGPDLLVDGVLVGAGLIITLFVCWWIAATQRFAAENPAQAILEGAELIEYKRFEAEAKGGIRSEGPRVAEDVPMRSIERRP